MKMIKQLRYVIFIYILFQASASVKAADVWKANWITDPSTQNATNSWFCFRKDFSLERTPTKAIAKIAVDSKYWLWINGQLVVFEGGLKRGPNPKDTYYDEVDISKFLEKGENSIAVLTWYFGKDGFSHISSGRAGLLFECIAPGIEIVSNHSWKALQYQAYETCGIPYPNYRLSESSIRFNARREIGFWQDKNYKSNDWPSARELGIPPTDPWNNLVLRPIPQWKNSGLTDYVNNPKFPIECKNDTVISCTLPANIQITPYLKWKLLKDWLLTSGLIIIMEVALLI